jgi:hypothetical protein
MSPLSRTCISRAATRPASSVTTGSATTLWRSTAHSSAGRTRSYALRRLTYKTYVGRRRRQHAFTVGVRAKCGAP